MLRRRTLSTAIVIAALMWASFFATVFEASRFMQQVLRYSAIRTGVAYLAIALTSVVVAAGIAARVVGRAWADRRGARARSHIGARRRSPRDARLADDPPRRHRPPFAGPDAAPSLSCRIYHGEHRTAGAPSVAQLSAALAT
jgi:hypothetical protein